MGRCNEKKRLFETQNNKAKVLFGLSMQCPTLAQKGVEVEN